MPTESLGPTTLTRVPDDVAADVAALRQASSNEAAVAAVRTMLEKSGVVITDNPVTAPPSAAFLFVGPDELQIIAVEVASSPPQTRATFAEFATAFAGMAMLPPNDDHLDDLIAIDSGATLPDLGSSTSLSLDFIEPAAHLSGFMATWIDLALANHSRPQPDLVLLTEAPLYVEALAETRSTPIDLHAAFDAGDYEMTALETTLLIAGMRATLAQAGIVTGAATAPSARLASLRFPDARPEGNAIEFDSCDQLKKLLDSKVPLGTVAGQAGKEYLKSMVEGFIEGLFENGKSFAKAVGPAINALGILFRVMALVLLYEHSKARLEINPGSIHKPLDTKTRLASAEVTAGIPDDEWEIAKQQREQSPFQGALRNCAKFLGWPVPSDLVDVGEATKNWRVGWEIRRGLGSLAIFDGQEFLGSGSVAGRLERPLQKVDDHSGSDSIGLVVMPETRSDHPGKELQAPLEVCALVKPVEPPSGFKNLLSTGLTGFKAGTAEALAGFATKDVISLISTMAELLAGWYRWVTPIRACATAQVAWHKPLPGHWRGTITTESRILDEIRTTSVSKKPGFTYNFKITSSIRNAIQATSKMYVSGDDGEPFDGEVRADLVGFAYVSAFASHESHTIEEKGSATCATYTTDDSEEGSGWSYGEDDGQAVLVIHSDGSYVIQAYGGYMNAFYFPTTQSSTITMPGGVDPNLCVSGSVESQSEFPSMDVDVSTVDVTGQFDPSSPPTSLSGSKTSISVRNGSIVVTTVSWSLVRDGPIRMP